MYRPLSSAYSFTLSLAYNGASFNNSTVTFILHTKADQRRVHGIDKAVSALYNQTDGRLTAIDQKLAVSCLNQSYSLIPVAWI